MFRDIHKLFIICILSHLPGITINAQEVAMSWMDGLNPNTNFGGWSGDYFTELYIPAADGHATSIQFNMSDLPDVAGGSMDVAIFSATYPWDEINTEAIADDSPASWLGYYADNDSIDITGDQWVYGGINAVEGADSVFRYDPLGEQLWPESGVIQIPLTPNTEDQGTLTLDLVEAGGDYFYFSRGEPFIVVVRLSGFQDQVDGAEYRTGFYSAILHNDPQPCTKFYNTISAPEGRTGVGDWGWHVRSYVWDWSVVAEFSTCGRVTISMEALMTTLSTADRSVRVDIINDSPSGGSSGITSPILYYSINNQESLSYSLIYVAGDEYSGIIPGQLPGTQITYWVEAIDIDGNTIVGEANTYSIFEVTEPLLLVFDDMNAYSGGYEFYYYVTLADTFANHFDLWEPKFGPVTNALVDNYELVYHVMGGGPYNDATTYSSVYADYLALGTAEAPRRLFITGQDYGAISGFADTTFPATAFENMYLGVETLGPQDINYDPDNAEPSYTLAYAINAPVADPLTGHLDLYAGDSLQMYYEPNTVCGFDNWIDNLTPSTGTVAFTDPNQADAAVAVYNEGVGWKTAFWTIDPNAIVFYSPTDTSSMYHWGLNALGGPIGPTFDWLGLPTTVGIDDADLSVPNTSKLHPSYPNPFNPVANIAYELGNASDVDITVYNMLGQQVATLVAGFQTAGAYSVQWNGIDQTGHSVSSGLYFYTMQTEGFSATQKMMLLK